MYVIDRVKDQFHRDMIADPVTHGWVLNLYLNGERYPQRVADYFQSEFAPNAELAENLRRHSRDEAKHVILYAHALEMLRQPVVELPLGNVFNQVIRMLTPETFHIVVKDPEEVRREKLANFLAHAHYLERRVARSFAYHLDACLAMRRDQIAKVVAAVHRDESRHVSYTREAVYDLVPRRRAKEVLELHRHAEAKANLLFSQSQVKVFLARFAQEMPARRRLLYRFSALVMEGAGHLV